MGYNLIFCYIQSVGIFSKLGLIISFTAINFILEKFKICPLRCSLSSPRHVRESRNKENKNKNNPQIVKPNTGIFCVWDLIAVSVFAQPSTKCYLGKKIDFLLKDLADRSETPKVPLGVGVFSSLPSSFNRNTRLDYNTSF